MWSRLALKIKIIAPLVLLAATFSIYMWEVWAPTYLQQERADYLTHYLIDVDLLAKGIAPDLAGDDFDEVGKALDQVKNEYSFILGISLRRKSGDVLYEFTNPVIPADADLEYINEDVNLAEGEGVLSVLINLQPAVEADRVDLKKPLNMLVMALLLMIVVLAVILDRWLGTPLMKLATATTAMASGDYEAMLPSAGNDEIGMLVGRFDAMRRAIDDKQQQLHREIAERRKAEDRLAKDFQLQKILSDVLRLSMEPISLEEMLDKALELVLALPWLAPEPKVAVFLSEENGGGLVMKVHRNMPGILLARCKKIAFGSCLCGRAAQERAIVFSAHVDERHEIQYQGMHAHGHIVIPILDGSELLGVINFYLPDGTTEESVDVNALTVMSNVLAIAIERKKSEVLLRKRAQILAQIHDAVIGVDHQCYITVWNGGAERLFGYAAEEMIGRSIAVLFPERNNDATHKEIFYSVLAEGYADSELTMVTKDGDYFIARLSASVFKGGDEASDGILAYVLDISQTKRMESELRTLNETLERQVKERTQEVLNQKFALDQHSIVGITDRAGRITYVNDKFCEISGYPREELIGQDHRILNSGHHSHDYFKEMWRTIGQGKVWSGEIKNRRKNGGYYWVYTTIVPFMNHEGKPYQYVSIRTDITERKKIYEEQANRAERLRRQQDAMLVLTRGGMFEITNLTRTLREVAEATGHAMAVDRAEVWLFGDNYETLNCEASFIPGNQHYDVCEILERKSQPVFFNAIESERVIVVDDISDDPRTSDLEQTYVGQRGARSLLVVPIRVDNGVCGIIMFEHSYPFHRWRSDEVNFAIEAANIVALAMEQVARRDAEHRLRELAQQLMKSNRKLDKALIDANAADRVKSEFLSVMSHEVRTPMNGIMGMLEMLRESSLDEQDKKYVEIAYKSSTTLLELLNDVLDFSKIEAGGMQLEIIEFNPAQVIAEVATLMRSMAMAKNLYLKVDRVDNIPTSAGGDPLRFRQVLLNLVNNAVKFSETGGVIISCELQETEDDALLRVEVADSGVGISAEDQSRIFEAFAQADSSTTRSYGGSGLGLTICRQLVQMMGGEIGVNSELGKGSLFWFTIRNQPVPGVSDCVSDLIIQ